jgi:hypothetical protein
MAIARWESWLESPVYSFINCEWTAFTLLDSLLGSKRIALDRVVFIEDDIELFGLA